MFWVEPVSWAGAESLTFNLWVSFCPRLPYAIPPPKWLCIFSRVKPNFLKGISNSWRAVSPLAPVAFLPEAFLDALKSYWFLCWCFQSFDWYPSFGLRFSLGYLHSTCLQYVFGTYQVSPKSLVASVTLQKGSSSKWRQLIKQILRVETNIIFLIVENIHPKIYDIMELFCLFYSRLWWLTRSQPLCKNT